MFLYINGIVETLSHQTRAKFVTMNFKYALLVAMLGLTLMAIVNAEKGKDGKGKDCMDKHKFCKKYKKCVK